MSTGKSSFSHNMDILRQHRVEFVQNLHSVPDVIDHLFSVRLLTRANKNIIESHLNSNDQVRELLDIITCKGPRVLEPFYDTLIKTDNVDLAKLLKADTDEPLRMTAKEENPSPVSPKKVKHEQKQYKVLVLHGNEENKEMKENIQFEQESCTRIIEKIKNAASPQLKNLVIFILGYFDGDTVEDVISCGKIPISEICDTLKEILPEKKKMCVLLHPKDIEPSRVQVEPDGTCQLVALSEDRLNELLKKLPTDDFLSSITHFINADNEIIWSSPGYILCLHSSDDAHKEEVCDFLHKQYLNKHFKYNTESYTLIEMLKSVQSSQNPAYLVVFLLGKFNGTEVEDVCSGDCVHITEICITMKGLLPKISKICILLQADDVKPDPVGLDKENDDTILIVSLTNERLTNLMKKLNHCTNYIPLCINNFVLDNEKIW